MKYLASIKRYYDRTTMLFQTEAAAKKWLDENNVDSKYLTYIEEFDEDWNKISGYIYTKGKENES